MENTAIVQPALIDCPLCSTSVKDTAFCSHCGYPIQGTADEQQKFVDDRHILNIDLEAHNKKIKRATIRLYYLSAIFVIWAVAGWSMSSNQNVKLGLLVVNGILALIFFGLGLWSKKKPVAALISGLALFVIVNVVNFIAAPISILSGIIYKIVIVVLLVQAIQSAMAAEKLKKDYNL